MRLAALILALFALAARTDRSPTGITAMPAQSLVNSIGVGEPSNGTASTVIADMAYLGIRAARDIVPFAGDGGGNYTTLAAAGIKLDFLFANDGNMTSGRSPSASLSATYALIDTLVSTYPGSVIGIEGPNEINNFPVWYQNAAATNSATASGNATLHFASTLPSLVTVAGAGYGSGFIITDTTVPTVIPSSTSESSATGTTVVMNANATGAGVGSGNTINFSAQGIEPSSNPSIAASGIAWQQDIYNITHADFNLSGVPVINFTDYNSRLPFGGQLGIAGTADANNQHIYPTGGSQPAYYFTPSYMANRGYFIIPGLPLWVTETGYYTMPDNGDGVDTNTQGWQIVNLLLDAFNAGVKYSLIYTLIDPGCDPGNTNAQYHYGLFDGCTGNPKASATAIHNLTSIMSDGGSGFSPGQLNYSVSNLPAQNFPTQGGGFSMLFQKSNGHFFIIVWNEPPIWNNSTNSEITPSTVSATVSLGAVRTTVNVYDPMTGTSPVNTYSSVSSVSLSLVKDPFIVEVVP